MTRTRARAAKGERAVARVPQGEWTTVTMLGALRLRGVVAAGSIPVATDGDVFRAFVREALAPVLDPSDRVVWDNLSAHGVAGAVEAGKEAGAQVWPLPPYSSDSSPIEPCWSKVKQALRDAGARTEEALGAAIAEAFARVTREDIQGWFRMCGFCVH
jgi:transposase